MLYRLAQPCLFSLEPERAHRLALAGLDCAHRFGFTRSWSAGLTDNPVQAMGLTFRNPVGLAAGLDKNAAHIDALADLGFGFIEVGTVTPLAQGGNPKPRLFRLTQPLALINRFGFNNEGIARFLAHIESQHSFTDAGGVLGLNIGKNADTPMDQAMADYITCLNAVYPLAINRPSYITINISSPNTKHLRDLQATDPFSALLSGVADARKRLTDRYGKRLPIAVKISPDLDDAMLAPMADLMLEHGMDAIVATNTTIDRSRVEGQKHATEAGGLSGAPLLSRSTHVVSELAKHLRGALPIIAVGGILSGDDVVAKLKAGATLVQLYTGLIYRGPTLVREARLAAQQWRAQAR